MKEKVLVPLHKTVHWREMRKMIYNVCKSESQLHGTLTNYNLNKIICYRTTGKEMNGRQVKTKNTINGNCCFVSTNSYDVFEIPTTSTTGSSYGEYLTFAHNIDFDYWVVTEMVVTKYEKSIEYNPIGAYIYYISEDGSVKVTKTSKRDDLGIGEKHPDRSFDYLGSRRSAYGVKFQETKGEKDVWSNYKDKGANKIKAHDIVRKYKK